MEGVDADGDGSISRSEWRQSWKRCAALKNFREKVNDDSLRAEMVAKYGQNGPEHIPLYAFGPKMSFYRLPLYPTNVDEREEGIMLMLSLKNFTIDIIADCVFFGCPFDASSTYRMGARFAPAAVRTASQMTSFKYSPWFDKHYSKFKIYDAGNLYINELSSQGGRMRPGYSF